jgi:hypothetical protein
MTSPIAAIPGSAATDQMVDSFLILLQIPDSNSFLLKLNWSINKPLFSGSFLDVNAETLAIF